MADSIAKLAVILTGDAGPLSAELQRATQMVDKWALGMARHKVQGDPWRSGIEKLSQLGRQNLANNPFEALNLSARKSAGGIESAAQASMKLATILSASRGNLAAAFTIGGPAALAITAMTVGVYKLAAAGDELMKKLGADKLDTWAGQWGRVNEQLGTMGLTFTTIAAEATGGLADALQSINEALFPESVAFVEALKARQAAEQQMVKDKEAAAKAAEKQAKANKEAAEAQERERDALLEMSLRQRDRGDEIRDSVMSPAEKLRQTFVELRGLLAGGFLDEESAIRAAAQAQTRFNDSTKTDRRDEDRGGVAAASRFTTAGFSAVQSSLREMDRLEKLEKEQLAEAKNAAKQRDEMIGILRGQTPIVLREGNL